MFCIHLETAYPSINLCGWSAAVRIRYDRIQLSKIESMYESKDEIIFQQTTTTTKFDDDGSSNNRSWRWRWHPRLQHRRTGIHVNGKMYICMRNLHCLWHILIFASIMLLLSYMLARLSQSLALLSSLSLSLILFRSAYTISLKRLFCSDNNVCFGKYMYAFKFYFIFCQFAVYFNAISSSRLYVYIRVCARVCKISALMLHLHICTLLTKTFEWMRIMVTNEFLWNRISTKTLLSINGKTRMALKKSPIDPLYLHSGWILYGDNKPIKNGMRVSM